MSFISWIYHFWARFWPYFNFVDFQAYFGHFSHVKKGKQRIADWVMKMASNQKMQENKPTLKFNFTIEKRWPVPKFLNFLDFSTTSKMCKGPMCTMQPALLGSVSQEFLEISHILKRLLGSTWVEWSALGSGTGEKSFFLTMWSVHPFLRNISFQYALFWWQQWEPKNDVDDFLFPIEIPYVL